MNSCCLLTNQLWGELSPAKRHHWLKTWPSFLDSERCPVQPRSWHKPSLHLRGKMGNRALPTPHVSSATAVPGEMGEMGHETTQGSTHRQINKYRMWFWEEQNHTWAPCVLETAPIFSTSICSRPCYPIWIKTCRTAFMILKSAGQVSNWRVFQTRFPRHNIS